MSSQPMPRCVFGATRSLFHLKLRVPGHQTWISPVVQSVMEVVTATPCGAGDEFKIETALREALANAVVHGCGNDPSKVVECVLSSRVSGELIIVVRDPGPGFDPASVPSPVTGENVYSNHGRGLFLIEQLMDDVRFERGGSEIHMVLKQATFPPTATARPVPPALPHGKGDRY